MKIRCIIVDDEPLARNVLEKHINKITDLELVAKCGNAIEAFNVLSNREVDLMFLDIQMPQITGIELLRSLKNKPRVIFTTAYREYAIDGYELDVIDYLLKPISFERFFKSINKVFSTAKTNIPEINEHKSEPGSENPYIFIKSDRKKIKIFLSEIIYIESIKDYVRIVTTDKSHVSYLKIGYLEEKLPSSLFLRIHKSFIINAGKIKSYTPVEIEMPGKILTIGRYYKQKVLKFLENRNQL
jgi:DNA-binding LytR/AlgR family response regulator